jgi:hypothetical protein
MKASARPAAYGNESISSLKGADRVRKRPGVIFGSDGLEGCEHAVFEILSNSIDEAREGHGTIITVTRYSDNSIEVEDFGRGCPVDWNPVEQRWNWELVYCELYAGGKYKNDEGENYEYSLGLNGLGSCATQYSSEYMDVTVWRDGKKYSLHFEKGENIGGLTIEEAKGKRTGTLQRWKPDQEVFTDYTYDVPSTGGMTSFEVPYVLPVNENGAWKFKDVSGRTLKRDGVEKVKTMFYEFEGWDPKTGWPTRESLEKLDLGFVADELEAAKKLGKA